MEIKVIKTSAGYYCSDANPSDRYSRCSLGGLLFDGVKPKETLHEKWVYIESEPKIVEREVSQPHINHRYELIDKSMETETIKPTFMKEEVIHDDGYWGEEYKHLSSLYEPKYDEQPNIKENVEFEFNIILETKEIRDQEQFAYDVQKTQWSHEGLTQITNKSATPQLLDQIIFPEPVLPMRPCSLTSEQTYKIVRQYVKENINPKAAEITSDYDFCFTIKKKIKLSEPEKYTVDVNFDLFAKRKKRPKYETRYRKERLVEIFEMTHAKRNYDNYTPIKGFIGENHTDLKEKIDFYLESLIEFINTPVVDCECCKGLGVRLTGKLPEHD